MAEYIEREKLPKRKEYWDDDFGAGWDACLDVIESIPAADVRPVVKARWENTGSDVWKCSACGYGIMPWNAGVNFCPNCGAEMEVSSDG